MKPAVFRPAARSRWRCIIGRRTRAWMPDRKMSPVVAVYLSSRLTVVRRVLTLPASLVNVTGAVAVVSGMVSPLVSDRIRTWERRISAPDPDHGPLFERRGRYFRLKNLRLAQCRRELTYTEIRNTDGGIRKSDGSWLRQRSGVEDDTHSAPQQRNRSRV